MTYLAFVGYSSEEDLPRCKSILLTTVERRENEGTLRNDVQTDIWKDLRMLITEE